MNFVEAIRSGRRIRRAIWESLKTVEHDFGWHTPFGQFNQQTYNWPREDVLADDWEVEPDPKKRLMAWIDVANPGTGSAVFARSRECFSKDRELRRAPWLDEPEVKA